MVGVYLSVWVRAALLPAVRGVQVTSVGTGIMGYLGNKGEHMQLFDHAVAAPHIFPYLCDSLGFVRTAVKLMSRDLTHMHGVLLLQIVRTIGERCVSVRVVCIQTTYWSSAGAVACRLRVHDTALCLLSAHLSSGENEGDELKRNYDYSEIVRRGAFPADVAAVDPAAALPGQQQDGVAKVRGNLRSALQ